MYIVGSSKFFCLTYTVTMMRLWRPSFALINKASQTESAVRKFCTGKFMNQQKTDDVVIAEVINGKGILTLNRPKALNALNLPMATKVKQKLKEWENEMQFVIVRGGGEKAFCAGGDVVYITSGSPSDCRAGVDFFRQEYSMDYMVGTYRLPYIAIIDGITMGGGVGLSVHGKYRIATERTMFAMPETAIGLFPDVGGSYFLPKLGGKLGLFLALTGHRLKGVDVAKVGIATHFVDSKDIPQLLADLTQCNRNQPIEEILNKHAKNISNQEFSLAPQLGIINECFSAPTVEEIFERLRKEGSTWSQSTVNTLKKMSPISLKITKVELEKGENLSLKESLQMEFGLAKAALEGRSSTDFYEGVRALLKDKDQNPKWNPITLEAVTDEMVQEHFKPVPPEEQLKL